ncbi:hypothetical protein SLS60_007542 [Paraconiothyrium brasiliense]|uniref:Uncharacterized protein n=1 Tax=Paraconiothyrium brasiliense TaxID=300254 RepID=A0ABR3R5M5_9PLEO
MPRSRSKLADALRCRGTTRKNTRCERQAAYPPDGSATTAKTRCSTHRDQERDFGDGADDDGSAVAPPRTPRETAIWKIAFNREEPSRSDWRDEEGGERTALQITAPPSGEEAPVSGPAVRFEQFVLDEPSKVVATFPQHRIPRIKRNAANRLEPLLPDAAACTETDRRLVNEDLLTRELAYGPALTGSHIRQTEALAHGKEELLVLRQQNADRDANDPASIYEDALLRLHHGSTIQAGINKKNADNMVVVSAQVETVSDQLEVLGRQLKALTDAVRGGQQTPASHRGVPRGFRARSTPQIGVAHALRGVDDFHAQGEAGGPSKDEGGSDVDMSGIRQALRNFSWA